MKEGRKGEKRERNFTFIAAGNLNWISTTLAPLSLAVDSPFPFPSLTPHNRRMHWLDTSEGSLEQGGEERGK